MNTVFLRVAVAVGAVAVGLIGGIAVAQNVEEITVQGTRIVNEKVIGQSSTGVAINKVSLSYGLSTAGLDLASHAGIMEAERRVKAVAEAACKELGKLYPAATPNDAECSKAAADKAMVKVNELAAAAGKAAGR